MKTIEASASRSWTLKLPKVDYDGEERFRPHEDVLIHTSQKASVGPDEDPVEAQKALHRQCEEVADAEIKLELAKWRVRMKVHLDAQEVKLREEYAFKLTVPSGFLPTTWKEFTEVRAKLTAITPTANVPVPRTNAEAAQMIPQMRDAIYAAERAEQQG